MSPKKVNSNPPKVSSNPHAQRYLGKLPDFREKHASISKQNSFNSSRVSSSCVGPICAHNGSNASTAACIPLGSAKSEARDLTTPAFTSLRSSGISVARLQTFFQVITQHVYMQRALVVSFSVHMCTTQCARARAHTHTHTQR